MSTEIESGSLRAFGRKRHPKDCTATPQTDFESRSPAEGRGLLWCRRCGWLEPHPFYRDDYDGDCSACGESGNAFRGNLHVPALSPGGN